MPIINTNIKLKSELNLAVGNTLHSIGGCIRPPLHLGEMYANTNQNFRQLDLLENFQMG